MEFNHSIDVGVGFIIQGKAVVSVFFRLKLKWFSVVMLLKLSLIQNACIDIFLKSMVSGKGVKAPPYVLVSLFIISQVRSIFEMLDLK